MKVVPVAQWIERLPSKQRVERSNRSRDATSRLGGVAAFPKNERNVVLHRTNSSQDALKCNGEERQMTTLADGIAAYRIFAQAEGKSPQTIRWIMSSVTYFSNFLGDRQDICEITANDLRHFIITLQQSPKFLSHPYTKPRKEKLSPQSIETYARAIWAFFSNLHREDLIDNNPMEKVEMPRVPKKVIPTFGELE